MFRLILKKQRVSVSNPIILINNFIIFLYFIFNSFNNFKLDKLDKSIIFTYHHLFLILLFIINHLHTFLSLSCLFSGFIFFLLFSLSFLVQLFKFKKLKKIKIPSKLLHSYVHVFLHYIFVHLNGRV